MNECDHDTDERCEHCQPSPVPDGRALLDAFKAEHGIKSDDLARSLMLIETFRPLEEPTPRALCTACHRSTHRDELIGGQCPRCVEQARG